MKKQESDKPVHISNPEVEEYAYEMTSEESEDIKTLIEQSDRELEFIDMLSGKQVGQLLRMLIKVSGAKKVLEIGTFTGYSAIKMAEALPQDGKLITLELNERYQDISKDHFDQFESGKKITLLKGDAKDLLNEIDDRFDFVFLDADKISYPHYYKKIVPMLNKGGLLVVDNVLWSGKVLHPDDAKSEALHIFNKMVKEDSRVEQLLLPVRDGITLIRKIN